MAKPPDVTVAQLQQLQREAAAAGDLAQVALCKQALRGSARARAICAQVIAHAKAQEDE